MSPSQTDADDGIQIHLANSQKEFYTGEILYRRPSLRKRRRMIVIKNCCRLKIKVEDDTIQ